MKSTDIISNLDWHLGKNDTRKAAEKGHIIINALSARNLSKNQNKDQTKGGDFIWSISKYSTLPYLQTKFDYTTVTMASLSTRQRFTTINELFDCGRDFLGGYITPMHIQVEEKVEREQVAKVTGTNKDEGPSVKGPVKRTDKKIYPNDLCPCGSGKKYKNCCGRKA